MKQLTKDGVIDVAPPKEVLTEVIVPTAISIRQARIVLSRNDLLSSVEQIVNSIGGEALIEWEYATSVDRSNPLVARVTGQAGMTKEQVDQMFIEGSEL